MALQILYSTAWLKFVGSKLTAIILYANGDFRLGCLAVTVPTIKHRLLQHVPTRAV
jgi:hypothetical protein